ncbi:MAG: hypothetical protein LBS35_01925 [Synergistaceae bacterium]|jgi:hypothetical protein|nr:hypothetical protein [Synergistaceae bacterium]
MSKDGNGLPGKEKEEKGTLSKVISLAPLLAVILQFLELILSILKIFGVIR